MARGSAEICPTSSAKKCIIDFASGTMAAIDFIVTTGSILIFTGCFFMLKKLDQKIKEQEKELKARGL